MLFAIHILNQREQVETKMSQRYSKEGSKVPKQYNRSRVKSSQPLQTKNPTQKKTNQSNIMVDVTTKEKPTMQLYQRATYNV